MRFFNFPFEQGVKDFAYDENGWKYKFKRFSKFGFASLKTPALKEITYSKGPTVRYNKYNVFCLGLIKENSAFRGIAFFELPLRPAISLFALLCGIIGSEWNISAFIVAFTFYWLIDFIMAERDNMLIAKLKKKFIS